MGATKLRKRGGNVSRLTDKQRMFVSEYAIDFNAKRAAIAAGYSEKTAGVNGFRLLKNPLVAAALGKLQHQRTKANGLEREEVLTKLSHSLHRRLTDFCDEKGNAISDLRKIPERAHGYIDGFEAEQFFDEEGNIVRQKLKFKLSSTGGAVDMAMKHKGQYAAQEVNLNLGVNWDSLPLEPVQDNNVIEGKVVEEQSDGQ